MQILRCRYKIIHSSFKFFVKRNWFMTVNGTRYRTIENPNGRYSFNDSRIAARNWLQEVLVFHLQWPLEFFQLKGLLMNCYFTEINEKTILGGNKAIISEQISLYCNWRNVAEWYYLPISVKQSRLQTKVFKLNNFMLAESSP